jgi:hypothetical protein
MPQVIEAPSTVAPSENEEARVSKLTRVLHLIVLLLARPGQMRVGGAARELGVSRRTLFRDLKALRAAGFRVQCDDTDGGYTLVLDERLPGLRDTLHELLGRAVDPAYACEWPFNWKESVALLAALQAANVPAGSEWAGLLQRVSLVIETMIIRQFGDVAASVRQNASLLMNGSDLSISQLHQETQERCEEECEEERIACLL